MSDIKALSSVSTDSFGLYKHDFKKQKFDGDSRIAFQFIPYLQDLFDKAGISYILDLNHTPHFEIPQAILRIQDEDKILFDQEVQNHDLAIHNWGQHILLHPQGPHQARPIFQAPVLNTTPWSRDIIKKYQADVLKHKSDSDLVISIILEHFADEIRGMTRISLETPLQVGQTNRHKAIGLWIWLRNLRQHNAIVLDNIRADFSKIPDCSNFKQALLAIEIINSLQYELHVMDQALIKTDSELVTILSNKLVGSAFREIKIWIATHDQHSTQLTSLPIIGAPPVLQPDVFNPQMRQFFAANGVPVPDIQARRYTDAISWFDLCLRVKQSSSTDSTSAVTSTIYFTSSLPVITPAVTSVLPTIPSAAAATLESQQAEIAELRNQITEMNKRQRTTGPSPVYSRPIQPYNQSYFRGPPTQQYRGPPTNGRGVYGRAPTTTNRGRGGRSYTRPMARAYGATVDEEMEEIFGPEFEEEDFTQEE